MDRREFLKICGGGILTLFLSGCGTSIVNTEKARGDVKPAPKGSVSGGKNMKIVVINSSPHSEAESTSRYISAAFVEGARSAGHEVFVFDAANSDTHPCRGCDACHMDGPCIFKDDIEKVLMPKMLEADMLVLATPLYYYTVSAQLKTIIDRFYSRTERLHGKKSMIIVTAYNSADWTMEATNVYYDTLCRYMEWKNVGKVYGIGCGSRSLVESSKFPAQAREIGKNL